MLQRIQSLFLLGAVIINVLLYFVPISELIPIGPVNTTDGVAAAVETFILSKNTLLVLLNGAVGAAAFLAIFLFKKRNLQVRLSNLCLLLSLILLGLIFFATDSLSSITDVKVHYLFGIYLPVIEIVFLYLAIRFIKRDEELVRSADRLR